MLNMNMVMNSNNDRQTGGFGIYEIMNISNESLHSFIDNLLLNLIHPW